MQLPRDFLVLIDVHLDETQRALGIVDSFLQRWAELLARPAPGRPEVDDHRHLARGFQHVGGEGLQRGVLDVRAGARGRLAGALPEGLTCGTNQRHSSVILHFNAQHGGKRLERKGL